MSRCLALGVLVLGSLHAAIWPEHLGPFTRVSAEPVPGSALAQEYGFKAAEKADYGAFQVTAAQFNDPTGAYAASLETSSLRTGNYVVTCAGKCPKDLASLSQGLPRVSQAPLPVLPTYLPSQGLVPHSARYILGPASLNAFAPELPPGPAAFQFGTEAALGHYGPTSAPETLAIFSYPTPQIARQQAAEFQKIPGAVVKRTGPLVAVVPSPKSTETAAKLIAPIDYRASVSRDEKPPVIVRPASVGNMLIAIFKLAGIVVTFCVLSGLVFGVLRFLAGRFGGPGAQGAMTVLRLSDK
ncbi:MAG: hypothetical protein M3Z32_00260 [Acidobacteriota bacterium]|nr:hypothetical protein [Acidobacteriota bacterium]